MSASGKNGVAGLVGMSGQVNILGLEGGCPKVPKKLAATKKYQKKPSIVNELVATSTQGESTCDRINIIEADSDGVTLKSSKGVKVDSTSSTTKKKGAPKDSTPSDVAAKSSSSTKAPEVETDPLLVYFDLETTGLSYSDEITQIACICTNNPHGGEFNVYTLPRGVFQPMASIITGLTKHGQSLYLHGKKVPTISLQEGLTQLLKWIEALPQRPLLVGHNSRQFDCPRLILALWNNNLLDLIHKRICGFVDSLPVFRTLLPFRREHKLESLLHEYCPNSTECSHNALDDCCALRSVLHEVVKASTAPRQNTAATGTGAKASRIDPATLEVNAATMGSDFQQDLIREALNESLLKEYFSVKQVLESMKRSAPARAVMKTEGS